MNDHKGKTTHEMARELLVRLADWCHKKTEDPFYVPDELALSEKKFERIEQQVLRIK